jgi:lipopolysaccharide/colanic/teichoic acid biosynthesis glycosyltransferase
MLEDKTISEDNKTIKSNARLENLILETRSQKTLDLIKRHVDTANSNNLFLNTTSAFNIRKQKKDTFDGIVNLKRINDIRRVNKFFEAANERLENGNIFICCVETKQLRKIRIMRKFWPILSLIYYFFDFILKRVFPKLPITKKIYFLLTAGRDRVFPKSEVLGRLYSCGFEIVEEALSDSLHYFVVKKIKEPFFDNNPSYGPIFKMRRIGKDGDMIEVYKLRTMHAYSEYLQAYIFEKNKLQEGGKIHNDIRITRYGKLFRKFWIDELPMIFNLIKGDLKLVGVRPLSAHFLSLYPEDLQELRKQIKPGLLPPFYADMPKSFDDIIASERNYILAYQKNPLKTDLKVIFAAFKNIILKNERSH